MAKPSDPAPALSEIQANDSPKVQLQGALPVIPRLL